MESTPYCISRGKAAGRSYFCRGNMIGNREYNETYHVFGKVKSMLKKKRCILREMYLKYEK